MGIHHHEAKHHFEGEYFVVHFFPIIFSSKSKLSDSSRVVGVSFLSGLDLPISSSPIVSLWIPYRFFLTSPVGVSTVWPQTLLFEASFRQLWVP